jgi:hypothetical protein
MMGKPGYPMTALEYTGGTWNSLASLYSTFIYWKPIEAQLPLNITLTSYDDADMYE